VYDSAHGSKCGVDDSFGDGADRSVVFGDLYRPVLQRQRLCLQDSVTGAVGHHAVISGFGADIHFFELMDNGPHDKPAWIDDAGKAAKCKQDAAFVLVDLTDKS